MKILVTGASGYVGSRLVPRLLADGHDVRISVTHPPDPDELWWLDRVEVAEMDALEPAQVDRAVAGTDAVYFLIHGMSGSDFATKDRTAATLMAEAVTAHHVERVVYLSGLVPRVPEKDLSEHIASRLEVERLLTTSDATVVALRAAILVGAASTSFEIVRQVSTRLPIQTIPTWMYSDVQPMAVVDAIEALVGALVADTGSRSYDVGGEERLSYPELVATYAKVAGITRVQVPVPLLPTSVVGTLTGLLTDVNTRTVESLVESLHHDMVCRDDDFRRALLPRGYRLLGVVESVERALAAPDLTVPPEDRDPMSLLPQDPAWAAEGRPGG